MKPALKTLLVTITLAVSLLSLSLNCYAMDRLILFHLDLNSVTLKEDYIRKWLRIIAKMGYNGVLWEVEDKVQWQSCPECISPAAFTKSQFRELINYSRSLGLQPIPLLQTLGHAEYVLRHRKYAPLREDPKRYDCYCPTNPATKSLLKTWIDEYLDLFGDVHYFHLGGDEAHVFGSCQNCRQKIAITSSAAVYTGYLKDIAKNLQARNIRPCIWSDMLLATPNDLSILDKRFVFFDWNYWDGDVIPQRVRVWSLNKFISKKDIRAELIDEIPQIIDGQQDLRPFYTVDFIKSCGYDVVLCSSSRSYGDSVFMGRAPVHLANIIGAAKKTIQDNLLGNCVTSWAVRIHNYETQAPFILLAPLALAHPELPRLELTRRASQQLFGVDSNAFYEAATNASFPFPFGSKDTTGIMWNGMKDGLPPPPGYIAHLLTSWQNKDDGEYCRYQANIIEKSDDIIIKGQNQLASYTLSAKTGEDILSAWNQAAYFQYYQSIIASRIISCHTSKSGPQTAPPCQLIHRLRTEYKSWAQQWMTEDSAEHASVVIYDALTTYIHTHCQSETVDSR